MEKLSLQPFRPRSDHHHYPNELWHELRERESTKSPMAFSSNLFFSPQLPKLPSAPVLLAKSHRLRSSSSTNPPTSSSSFDLRTYWSTLLSQIESQLDSAIPIRFPSRIYESMRHSVLSPSAKRAAPIMCIAACELLGLVDRSAAFPTACALEMVHAASLVHDDLPCMDSALLRRGLPSNHALFGVDIAILAGDALFPLGFQHIVSRTPPSLVPPQSLARVIAEIARAVGSTGMAAGQFLDLQDDSDVVLVLEKKFGEMGECSAVCGGILGGAGVEEVERLRRYGRAVGVLYQVVDDILMEERGVGANGSSGKMKSNASVVRKLGMERAMEMVEELRGKAKREIEPFGEKYGERVLPLYSFVDYAVERGFVVDGGVEAAAGTNNSYSS